MLVLPNIQQIIHQIRELKLKLVVNLNTDANGTMDLIYITQSNKVSINYRYYLVFEYSSTKNEIYEACYLSTPHFFKIKTVINQFYNWLININSIDSIYKLDYNKHLVIDDTFTSSSIRVKCINKSLIFEGIVIHYDDETPPIPGVRIYINNADYYVDLTKNEFLSLEILQNLNLFQASQMCCMIGLSMENKNNKHNQPLARRPLEKEEE
jgi:hypothetical protein